MNISQMSAAQLGQQIAAKKLSSVELTQHFLDQIQQLDPNINAFVSVNDAALESAAAVDQRVASGESLSPLAGVPIAIKDVLCQQGSPTTCGSRMLENYQPNYNATAVQKLQDAGMVVLGKTNMDEFAMGGSTETSISGPTHNPWNLDLTAGGSSGGSAAATAAGLAPLAVGTDTGGSVRQPAAFCGVCGIKPTYGRVSRYGLVAFASSLDQVGGFAHHAEDLALLLETLSGHDPRDSTSLPEPVPAFGQELEISLRGIRIGVIREHIENEALDASIRESVKRSVELVKQLGAEIRDVHLPHTQYAVPAYYVIAPCEASGNLARYDGVHYGFRHGGTLNSDSPLNEMIANSRSQGFGAEVKRRVMLGTFALSAGYYDAYYKKALQVRRLISQDYQQAFEQVDVLLGPVTPTTPYRLGAKLDDPVQMYLGDLFTVGANLSGIPALSIPAGFSQERLPLAIQLQAPALEEARLLSIAHQLQAAGLYEPQLAKDHDDKPAG